MQPDWRAAGVTLLSAILVAAQLVRVHPSAWIPLAIAPLASLAVPSVSWRRRLGLAVAIEGAIGIGALALSGQVVMTTLGHLASGDTFRPHAADPRTVVLQLAPFLLVTLLLSRRRWLLVSAGLSAFVWWSLRESFGQSELWRHSFDTLYLPSMAPAVVSLLPEPDSSGRKTTATLAIATLVCFIVMLRLPVARTEPTTARREYDELRVVLRDVPRGCRVVWVGFAGRRALFLPSWVIDRPFLRLDLRQPLAMGEVLRRGDCAWYVHTSLCATSQGKPACDEIERQLRLSAPLWRETFPAVADGEDAHYLGQQVEVFISKVNDLAD